MFSRTIEWIHERFPLRALAYWSFHEEIPGGSSFAYTLGSSLLFVFLLQVLTGAWQLFYYVPTVDHAYQSLGYLRLQVPFGWLIHNLHYWGNNAFIVLIALHIARVFIWGAYKEPRQLVWLTGAALVLFTAGITFTGAVLAWDELGYWAGEVGTDILGTVPLIGDFIRRVMRGGETMHQLALSRFFAWHVVVFAVLIAAFIVFHLIAFRQFGSVGPWNPQKVKKTGWFWPNQIAKDLIVISALFALLVGLSAFVPGPITGPADPVDTTYSPKPEWNFLFLYQALKVFRGRWEPVGTVVLPLALILALFLLPFFDRREERRPRKRPYAMAAAFAVAAWIIAATFIGYYTGPAEFTLPPGQRAVVAAPSPTGAALAPPAAPSSGIRAGGTLFRDQGCTACHKVNGEGGTAGPDLSNEGAKGRTRDWLATQLRDPKAHNPSSIMPSYSSLSEAEINQLVDYLGSLGGMPAPAAAPPLPGAMHLPASGKQGPPGPAALMIGSSAHGAVLYEQSCRSCHGAKGVGSVPNPGSADGTVPPLKPIDPALFSKDPAAFADNIDRFIQHGSRPNGPNPALSMPAFGETNTLTQPQIANIEAYVLSLNGVDRARILYPGVAPWLFFVLTVGAFAAAWLGLGIWWLRARAAGAVRARRES